MLVLDDNAACLTMEIEQRDIRFICKVCVLKCYIEPIQLKFAMYGPFLVS